MTAPLSDDEIRAALAEVLPHLDGCLALYPPVGTTIARTGPCTCWRFRMSSAAALLPVVRDIAAREAARELEAAAVAITEGDDSAHPRFCDALRARALGLDPTHGKATT
jgi:hypothetical protein